MSNNLNRLSKLFWGGLAFFSAIALIWRIDDFIDESTKTTFYMTRFGLRFFGIYAELVQLSIILFCAVVLWFSVRKLKRLFKSPETE